MTDPRSVLDVIRQRADNATDGPWEHELGGAVDDDYGVFAHGAGAVVIAAEGEADAEFIAAARSDVPRLVAALTAALDLADEWDRAAGPDSRAWSVFGPQKVSVPFATKSIRAVIEAALTEEES